jgi:chromosome segregation ATPase
VIRRLLAEIDVSRELLARHEERERALVKEIEQAEQSYQQLSAAYRTALIEIGALRAGLQAERRALAERQAQVAELRADKEKAQRAAGKWRGRFFKSVLVTLVLAGVVVIPR